MYIHMSSTADKLLGVCVWRVCVCVCVRARACVHVIVYLRLCARIYTRTLGVCAMLLLLVTNACV